MKKFTVHCAIGGTTCHFLAVTTLLCMWFCQLSLMHNQANTSFASFRYVCYSFKWTCVWCVYLFFCLCVWLCVRVLYICLDVRASCVNGGVKWYWEHLLTSSTPHPSPVGGISKVILAPGIAASLDPGNWNDRNSRFLPMCCAGRLATGSSHSFPPTLLFSDIFLFQLACHVNCSSLALTSSSTITCFLFFFLDLHFLYFVFRGLFLCFIFLYLYSLFSLPLSGGVVVPEVSPFSP